MHMQTGAADGCFGKVRTGKLYFSYINAKQEESRGKQHKSDFVSPTYQLRKHTV